jgi:hypothetical protein
MSCAALIACGGNGESPIDASPTDASTRRPACSHSGTSSVTGEGPLGDLGGHYVYAFGVDGFCPDGVHLTLATENPVAYPNLPDTVDIRATVTLDVFDNNTRWSGTFPATIELEDESYRTDGTLDVETSTPDETHIRATATFDTDPWHLTVVIDAPYCDIDVCI